MASCFPLSARPSWADRPVVAPAFSRPPAPVGKITLPSTILQFWDLGGQRDIRSIWHRYYDDCQAVIYVIDASDEKRMEEGWAVFGASALRLCLPLAA